MAEPLTDGKLAQRRQNLAKFREIGMEGESQLTTNLEMQEEWLATVDARDKRIEALLWLVGEKDRALGPFAEAARWMRYARGKGVVLGSAESDGRFGDVPIKAFQATGRAQVLTEADAPKE